MVFKFVKKISGFTLVETMTALLITAVSVILILGALTLVTHNQRHQEKSHQMDFEQFTTILYGDGLDLAYQNQDLSQGRVNFYSQKDHQFYTLRYQRQKLWLLKNGRGYMPLIYDVDDFQINYDPIQFRLHLKVKVCGSVYEETVVMPKYETVEG